jgi:hypothetical protein
MFSLAGKFLRHILPGIVRPLRVLWNQLIGFLFLLLAIAVGAGAMRRGSGGQQPALQIVGLAFALFLAFFGVTSFLKARKISRS